MLRARSLWTWLFARSLPLMASPAWAGDGFEKFTAMNEHLNPFDGLWYLIAAVEGSSGTVIVSFDATARCSPGTYPESITIDKRVKLVNKVASSTAIVGNP